MSYRTITVGEGEHRVIDVERGATFENVLIDVTRDGASATLDARTAGWTIRNVGFVGRHDNPEGPALRLADAGAQRSVADWIYLGDGGDGTGVTVEHTHNGELLLSRIHASDFGNRAFDSARPRNVGAAGTVRYVECYGAGSLAANFQTGDDELVGCLADTAGAHTGRGVWAHGETRLRNCDLVTNGDHYAIHAGVPGNTVDVTAIDTAYDTGHDGGLTTADYSSIIEHNTATTPDATLPDVPADATSGADGATAPIGGSEPTADNYEVLEAPLTYTVDSGETWANKLIDVGDQRRVTITAKGTDWAIKNIGFIGTLPTDSPIFTVCDGGGGRATIENVHFREGDPEQQPGERGQCIRVDPNHVGHLDIRNVYFDAAGNTALDASPPATTGSGGTVSVEGCYATDAHHTAYKIGDNDCTITNSVAYKSGDRAAERGVWVVNSDYGGTATLTDLDIETNGEGVGVAIDADADVEMQNVNADDGTGTSGTPDSTPPPGSPDRPAVGAAGVGPTAPDPFTDEGPVEHIGPGAWQSTVDDTTDSQTFTIQATTGAETVSSAGPISQTIDGLETGAEYEYRAVVEANGQTERGTTREFIAEEGGGNTDGGSQPIGKRPGHEHDYPDDPGRNETVTVEVEPGDHYFYTVEEGETFENVIIDCTNKNAAATLYAVGGDWTIRNVAFAGSADLTHSGPCWAIVAEAASGTTGLIDNVWLGDGSHVGRRECNQYGRGAIKLTDNHAGTIRVERSTIAWWPGAGIDGVAAAASGGTVDVASCYFENLGHVYSALGTANSSMENCVINHYLTDPDGGNS